jgi:hypothetical protein
VVFEATPGFWARGEGICDVAHPYLYVLASADFGKGMAAAAAIRDRWRGRMGPCLAKVTWGPEDKVTPAELAAFDGLARQRDLPYFFWTADTLFLDGTLYDPPAVAQALGLDYTALEPSRQRLAAGAAPPEPGKSYSVEEVRTTPAAVLFERLTAPPEPGYDQFAALRALIAKAASGDPATAGPVIEGAKAVIRARGPDSRQRWLCCYVLSGSGDKRVVPVLAEALLGDPEETVRAVAACAIGVFATPEATAALKQAEQSEKSPVVLAEVNKALAGASRTPQRETQPAPQEALDGKRVTLVLVKDFMRLENTGPALREVEFERYFPAVDAEQFALARWITARTDAGEALPVSVAAVTPDPQGNLIHTYRLATFPETQQVLVTVTTLMARRERPAPQGAFPIPAPDKYPAAVRRSLAATPLVARDDPVVRQQADELLAGSRDAYQVATKLASVMHGKSYAVAKDADLTLTTAALVLTYGGSCCGSAVAAAAVLRACGIPAELTYCPAGYIHGIVRFYLNGYGWVRMDSTCGVGKLPLVQQQEDLGLVRLYDMPIAMEAQVAAYAWPYMHNDLQGPYQFRAAGRLCSTIRFAMVPPVQAGGTPGYVERPFPHLECGSWNRVLGGERLAGPWRPWDALAAASRAAVRKGTVGEFASVMALLPGVARYADLRAAAER